MILTEHQTHRIQLPESVLQQSEYVFSCVSIFEVIIIVIYLDLFGLSITLIENQLYLKRRYADLC